MTCAHWWYRAPEGYRCWRCSVMMVVTHLAVSLPASASTRLAEIDPCADVSTGSEG